MPSWEMIHMMMFTFVVVSTDPTSNNTKFT